MGNCTACVDETFRKDDQGENPHSNIVQEDFNNSSIRKHEDKGFYGMPAYNSARSHSSNERRSNSYDNKASIYINQ